MLNRDQISFLWTAFHIPEAEIKTIGPEEWDMIRMRTARYLSRQTLHTDDAHRSDRMVNIARQIIKTEYLHKDGGPGSGNWGHEGRPGVRGGSGKGGGIAYRTEKTLPGGEKVFSTLKAKREGNNKTLKTYQDAYNREANNYVDKAAEAFPTIDTVNNGSDATNYLLGKRYFIQGEDGGYNTVNLTAMKDPQLTRNTVGAIDKVMTTFPEMQGKTGGIVVRQQEPRQYGQCDRGDHGRVTLNSLKFGGSEKAISDTYARDVSAGFHPKNTPYNQIVTHEFMHALDFATISYTKDMRTKPDGKPFLDSLRTSDYCVTKGAMDTNKTINRFKSSISRYSREGSGCSEAFAEAMAEALTGPSPRKEAMAVYNNYMELRKGKSNE